MSYNLKSAVELIDDSHAVNPETFAFSLGSLLEPYLPKVVQEGDIVNFYWEKVGDSSTADPSDRTMLLLYGMKDQNLIIYGNMRADLQDSLSIKGSKSGERYHAYIAFISIKNQQVSNSVYIGMLTVKSFENVR